MASTIITKHGTGSAVPASLQQGELAINVDSGSLYYGTSGSSNAVSSSFYITNLTASGNISSSGTIIGDTGQFSRIEIDGEVALDTGDSATTGRVFADSQITKIVIGKAGEFVSNKIVMEGNVTSSGQISASGAIHTDLIFGNGTLNINPNPNGPAFVGNTHALQVYGGIRANGPNSFTGTITATGNISASRVSASAGFEADTASTSSFGHISSSGMIYSETNISASGIINSEGDISSSANIGAIGNAYNGFMPGTGSFGNVTASHTIHVGSAVPLGHGITLTHTGQISASRVSASAGFEADTLSTSSFGYISASGNISSSGTGMNYFGGNIQIGLNTAFVGTLQAVGNVNAEHLYSSDDAVIDDNLQVGGGINVLGNGGNVGHISASGNVSASGFDTRITPAASADAFSYSVNGRKVEVRNQLQAQLDDGTFTHIELRNTSIATDSIVLGSFTGNTITNITGSIITAATTALYTASIQIHNETAENITNDTSYTASFIIL